METEHYGFILIADEKYWNRLSERKKANREVHAFVRKNQVAPRKTQKLLFYIKKPLMQIRGVADFIERLTGNREELWQKYGAETCFETMDEYAAFSQGRQKMTLIRFKNFTELQNPTTTEIINIVLGSLQGFRGKYVNEETAKKLTP
jgi:predicted transcriptional regulator